MVESMSIDLSNATDFEVFVSALQSPDPNTEPSVKHEIGVDGEKTSISIPLPNCPDDADAKLILKFLKGALIAADIEKYPPDPPEPFFKDIPECLISVVACSESALLSQVPIEDV